MIKKAITKETKRKELFRVVSCARMDEAVDKSCQWKGGAREPFCRATKQESCLGCKFYTVGIWDFLARCYDLLYAQDREITKLRQENEDLRNGINFPRK